MQIKFSQGVIKDPEKSILRCGYAKIIDRRMGKISFAKRIHRDFYPRFHVYIKIEAKPRTEPHDGSGTGGDTVIFDLHLDQKRPIYEGVTAHSGEYDGEVVEREAARLASSIK